jgi:LPXTG-site transpeptidase (sortase) family protein
MIAREHHRRLGSSRTASSAVLLVLGLVLLAVPAAGVLTSEPAPASGHSTLRGVTRPVAQARVFEHTAERSSQPVDPRLLVVDTIGISADVEKIGLTADGALSTPTDVANVGWYSGSSRPGDKGPAVIVGHVDSGDGPAVFARLAELEVGDVVTVENGGEAALSFAVSTVARHPKDSFPSEAVYGASPDAELRLITCGGRYDRDSGYADNVVVFARALTS